MYYLLMPSLKARTEFIARLKEQGVTAVFHYLPLNRSAYATAQAQQEREDRRWKLGECPVTEDVADRLVRLPFFTSMAGEEQARVIGLARDFKA